MVPEIKQVLIVANEDKEGVQGLMKQISRYFLERDIQVMEFSYHGDPPQPSIPPVDLAVVLGGDGTVLFSSRILASVGTPILAINLGNVGFVTEVSKDEWEFALTAYLAGDLGISSRIMVKSEVWRKGQNIAQFSALNDAVVGASGSSKIVNLDLDLSGINLGSYRADGIIVATPTGSTAYNLAAGGPILHPETEAFIITPVCPHSLSHRPLVVPATEVLTLKLKQKQRTGVSLTIDGRDVFPLEPDDNIIFRRLKEKTHLIRSTKRSFYEVVRTKLN
jgi:NAD+ kinase